MIGILTFHASHNCGSMLQAFALQKVLKEHFNKDSEIIDFSNAAQQKMYEPFWPVTGLKSLIKNGLWATVLPEINKQRSAYFEFSKKYFKLTPEKYTTDDELKSLDGRYEKLICGSDQVWNICCMDADDAYYLDFAENARKYAYAVSFGANNSFKLNPRYIDLVKKFSMVSVRERNAQKWIKEDVGITVPICLDPTMLLDANEWEKSIDIGDKPIIASPYIFYYCFSISQEIERFLKEISKKTGMPVYFLEPKEWALRMCWRNDIRLVKKYGPESFLNLMKNASMVFTTSFHGTAFSTIFHKNFWYINSGHNDLSKDDRAVSFLNQLGLIARYKTIDELKKINLRQEPNYAEVQIKLEQLQKQSFKYLEKVVHE